MGRLIEYLLEFIFGIDRNVGVYLILLVRSVHTWFDIGGPSYASMVVIYVAIDMILYNEAR